MRREFQYDGDGGSRRFDSRGGGGGMAVGSRGYGGGQEWSEDEEDKYESGSRSRPTQKKTTTSKQQQPAEDLFSGFTSSFSQFDYKGGSGGATNTQPRATETTTRSKAVTVVEQPKTTTKSHDPFNDFANFESIKPPPQATSTIIQNKPGATFDFDNFGQNQTATVAAPQKVDSPQRMYPKFDTNKPQQQQQQQQMNDPFAAIPPPGGKKNDDHMNLLDIDGLSSPPQQQQQQPPPMQLQQQQSFPPQGGITQPQAPANKTPVSQGFDDLFPGGMKAVQPQPLQTQQNPQNSNIFGNSPQPSDILFQGMSPQQKMNQMGGGGIGLMQPIQPMQVMQQQPLQQMQQMGMGGMGGMGAPQQNMMAQQQRMVQQQQMNMMFGGQQQQQPMQQSMNMMGGAMPLNMNQNYNPFMMQQAQPQQNMMGLGMQGQQNMMGQMQPQQLQPQNMMMGGLPQQKSPMVASVTMNPSINNQNQYKQADPFDFLDKQNFAPPPGKIFCLYSLADFPLAKVQTMAAPQPQIAAANNDPFDILS